VRDGFGGCEDRGEGGDQVANLRRFILLSGFSE
jgi:hypothetical protein